VSAAAWACPRVAQRWWCAFVVRVGAVSSSMCWLPVQPLQRCWPERVLDCRKCAQA
jgi:hypothetical protein